MNESLRRAYAACERGRYDEAIDHLRDGADLAAMAGDERQRAACTRAIIAVQMVVGRPYLARVQ